MRVVASPLSQNSQDSILLKFYEESHERNRSTVYDPELHANSAFNSSRYGGAGYRVQFEYTGCKNEMTDSMSRIPYQDVHRLTISGQFYGNYFLSPRLGLLSGIYFKKSIWHTKKGLMEGIRDESIYQDSVLKMD
jgi:hypothetical protein